MLLREQNSLATERVNLRDELALHLRVLAEQVHREAEGVGRRVVTLAGAAVSRAMYITDSNRKL